LTFRHLRWFILWPGFWVYEQVARWTGIDFELVALDAGFSFPRQRLKEVLKGETPERTMVVVINPNNPTGNLFPYDALEELLDRGSWLLVDEAYYEYAGMTAADWIPRRPRLLVLRTLSKAFGLAGLRVGYLLAQEAVAADVHQHKLPLTVSSYSLAVASSVVAQHRTALGGVGEIIRERERLASLLGGLGLRVCDSRANFLLAEVGNAAAVSADLADRGYAVRHFPCIPSLSGYVRISIGTPADSDGLISALRAVLERRVPNNGNGFG